MGDKCDFYVKSEYELLPGMDDVTQWQVSNETSIIQILIQTAFCDSLNFLKIFS